MEKGGFKRLGRLFHKSESEDSEPESTRDTPFSSPCPSPSLQGRRQQQQRRPRYGSPPAAAAPAEGERKKRPGFGQWRLKRKPPKGHLQPPQQGLAEGSAPASPALSRASYCYPSDSEPTTPTNSNR